MDFVNPEIGLLPVGDEDRDDDRDSVDDKVCNCTTRWSVRAVRNFPLITTSRSFSSISDET
jgi:hypothetical protein